jgi:hypothetical protein
MVKETATRIGINLTPGDKAAIRKLKQHLKAEHGKVTTSAAIRIAVRKATAEQK